MSAHPKNLVLREADDVYPPQEDSFLLADALNGKVRKNMRVLDMGTGSGLLAIIAAKRGASALATDISAKALALAERNAKENGVQIGTRKSDLFQKITGKFDIIIFNPPYLPVGEMDSRVPLSESWSGGRSGREKLDAFLRQCKDYLTQEGRILFVQSSLTGIEKTEKLLTRLGFDYKIVARKKIPWEELVVFEAWRTRHAGHAEHAKHAESAGVRGQRHGSNR